jgi:hypothetical protein
VTRVLTLMGSGETSPTMVKTHRELLARVGSRPAALLDTPFGFQSNADELTARAQQYFTDSVGRVLDVATFRSADAVGTVAYEQTLDLLRNAGYVFAGPGSPTYALRQWRSSLIPTLLSEKLVDGSASAGCVTFASAAALTLGVVTVPVYEIYKVGEEPGWAEGLDVLGDATGLRAAVIPHFNNAEGGTHDTRFCYLGEARLQVMERALPDGAFVIGVDEHTGLVIDLDAGDASVVGIGVVTLRWPDGSARLLESGTRCAIEDLSASGREDSPMRKSSRPEDAPGEPATSAATGESPLVGVVRGAEAAFTAALGERDVDRAVQTVLDLDGELQQWANETFSSDEMDQARAAFRAMLVRLGGLAETGARDPREAVAPFVDTMLDLRDAARADKRYADAAPGKPTMKLERTPAWGALARMVSSSSRKRSVSPKRRIARSTSGAECWKERSK